MAWIINILSNYLRFIISLVVMVCMTPYIIATIGVTNYGLWAVVYAVVGLLGLADMGFATTAVKYIAERKGAGDAPGRNSLLGSLCLIYGTVGLSCLLLTLLASEICVWQGGAASLQELIWILGSATAVGMALSIFRALLIGVGRQDLINIITIISTLIQTLITIFLLEAGWGIKGIAWATAIGIIGQAIMAIPLAFRVVPDFRPVLDNSCRDKIREMWSFAFYAMLANISVLMVLKIDPLIVQGFMSMSMVALYAIAAKIAEQLLLLNKQLSNALMPLISQAKGKGDEEMIRKVFLDGTRYLLLIAIPMLGLVCVYAEELIVLWVGEEFSQAGPLLKILTLAVLISTLILNAANVLGMTGRHRLVAASLTASALLNLGLSVVLIQVWGLNGVAWATFCGIFLCELLILLPAACRSLGVSISRFFQKSVLPGLLCALPSLSLALVLTSPASLAELIFKCLIYEALSLTLFICFGTTATERQFISQLKNRFARGKNQCVTSTVP